MLLEVDDPPPSFLSYIKHWVNHGGLHGNPDVKSTVAAWADEVAGNVRVEGR
jgi:hypothetical protein